MQFTPETLEILNSLEAYGEVFNVISLLLWPFMAMMLFLIGRKTDTDVPWLAFIPIVQYVQMVRISRKPPWWLALILLLPILAIPMPLIVGPIDPTEGVITLILAAIFVLVAVVAWLLVWIAIAAERGKSAIWGVLAGIPCTSPIGLGYLGLSR